LVLFFILNARSSKLLVRLRGSSAYASQFYHAAHPSNFGNPRPLGAILLGAITILNTKTNIDFMTTETIFSTLSLLGIGGIIGAYIKNLLDKRKELDFKLNELNEGKFRSILVFMSILLRPENKKHFTVDDKYLQNLSEEDTKKHCIMKIQEYYYHSMLYASDDVIKSIKSFIQNQNRENYVKVTKEMRVDLWNKKSKLTFSDLFIE